ncbi:MAG: ATP-binding protein, partial [Pirellulaceae bacterium]
VRFEYEHPGPPSPVWFSVVVACIGPAEPNRVRFAYTVEDVTQRKRAEQELREREELLKTATDAADLGIWELDVASDTTPKRTIRHDQMFGFHELQPSWGRAIAERHVLDEDKPRFREAFERAMESGILSFEVRVRWPDGTVHWIAPLGRVYYDDQGRAVRMAGVVADITERKRTEERLREADRRKDEFLAILAHELRNPLAPIRNGLQLLRLRQSDPATTQRTYAMMERQADHMIRLVDDLLEITRITRGQIELRKSYLDAATVVHRTVETSRPKLDAAGHELVLELPSQPLTLHADPVRLTQVLTNLLVNAAKYTEHGGRIVVSAWPDGEEAILSVRDNGVGIPAEVLPHVFELFEQVERSYNHDHGGLGIGLMLVRRLVELHGGTVEARSDGPGCGSEFRVHLPLAAGQLEAAPAGPPVADLDALAGARILIADDNHDVAESLTMLLEAMSADVCTVHEGAAALARLDTYRPTIVILDIGMPGMDGYEVARRVRQHPAGRGVTLISLSGWGHETDRRRSRAAGFDHHLVKPVGLRTLLAALHSAPPSADRMASTS